MPLKGNQGHQEYRGHANHNLHHRAQQKRSFNLASSSKKRIPSSPSNSNSNSNSKSNSKRCWDWIIVGGNCHYAKNRSSFRTYRRAPGKIGGARVLGVGSVELKVRRAPSDDRRGTLVLQDVLHIPNARCNGLSIPKYREANPLLGVESECESGERVQVTKEGNGEALWYGDEYFGWSRVVLWGNPRGESYLRDGRAYMLSVFASAEELEKLFTRVRERSLV